MTESRFGKVPTALVVGVVAALLPVAPAAASSTAGVDDAARVAVVAAGAVGVVRQVVGEVPASAADTAVTAAATGRTCTWRLTRLPNPAGGRYGEVRGTDGGTRWVGLSSRGATLWQNGRVRVLGPGRAKDVNRHGVVVGGDNPGTNAGHAVMWVNGRRIRLAEPPGIVKSSAEAINDDGLIVGWGARGEIGGVGLVWSVRSPDRVRVIRYPGREVTLWDVSASGRFVGMADVPGADALFGRMGVQGTLRTGIRAIARPESGALSISGRYTLGWKGTRPVLWRSGTSTVVAYLRGIRAIVVNRSAVVAGQDSSYRPVVWRAGVVRRLPLPRGVTGATPLAINDAGQIAGSAGDHAALWTCR